jgi:penicillin-binding protein 1A
VLATVKSAADALTPWPSRAPMLQLLQSAVRNGTGNAARLPIPTYGKTGTTQSHRDALFIGFAGNLVVGVWVGNDDNTPMSGAVVGGSVPAKLWRRFMTAALTRDGALARPAVRTDPLGDLVGAIAGPEAGAATDAVSGVINDAANGKIDPAAVADTEARISDAVNPPPETVPQ